MSNNPTHMDRGTAERLGGGVGNEGERASRQHVLGPESESILLSFGTTIPDQQHRAVRVNPYTRLSVTMKTAALLVVLVLGKTAEAFVASPFTARAAGGVSSVCGADHRCEWTVGAVRRRSGGVCMATSSELDQSAE